MAKKIYLGSSNFEKIISNNGLFVDKSLFIRDIIEDTSDVILLARPRRFGKTLNMSMLHHFFAPRVNYTNTQGLFNNLKIAEINNGTYLQEHQGQYPVIFISFKNIKALDYKSSCEQLSLLVRNTFALYYDVFTQSTELNPLDQITYQNYVRLTPLTFGEIEESLLVLSKLLYKHHKQKVVILMDEYDTPLNAAYTAGYLDELTSLMRNLMSSAFKDNDFLYKGVLTGILRISKDSMLSGLNNLKTYTILDSKYNEYFGFTNEELDYLFKEQELLYNEKEAKSWYNGYNFAGLEIYNPWSILNCLSNNGKFDEYWVHTSNNSMIEELLLTFREDVNPAINKLMEGHHATVNIDRHVTYNTLNYQASSLWSLLLFAGYLTTDATESIGELAYQCAVRVPNLEVVHLLNYYYKNWLSTRLGIQYQSFLTNLAYGRVEEFTIQLNTYLVESLSVRDTGYNAEKFYHGLVLGLIASLNMSHVVRSNYESGFGYPDVIIYPKENNKLHNLGLVLEFKHAKEDDSENMEQLALQALEQINTKNYAHGLKQHPQVKQVLKVGLAFNHKQVIVKHELS